MESAKQPGRVLWKSRTVATAGFLLAVIGALLLGFRAHQSLTRIREGQRWIEHTGQVQELSTLSLSALKDAETGQRGYLLTGRLAYLLPYEHALPEVRRYLAELRTGAATDAATARLVAQLQAASDQKLRELAETIAFCRAGNL